MIGTDHTCRLTPEQLQAVRFLANHWPAAGKRNAAYKALVGGLLRDEVPVETVEALVAALAEATRDEDGPVQRVLIVARTAERLKANQACQGWPKACECLGEETVTTFRTLLGLVVTLEQLAQHKRLSVEFLRGEGLYDLSQGGVAIPYRDAAGKVIATKVRRTLTAKGSRWPLGRPPAAYGEDRVDLATKPGRQTIVEGESDCWTLWHHGEPALGLPGADSVHKTLCLGHVATFRTLHVVQEPDAGGEAFVGNVRRKLAELGWSGTLRVVRLGGAKDPSELHCQDPAAFLIRWRESLNGATEAEPVGTSWPDPVPLSEVPAAAPFPLHVFPAALRRAVEEVSSALPCPPDYVAVPALVLAGAAIGASRALAIKAGHVQRASLYAGVVGPPGSAKSPALETVVEPAHDVEERLHATWEEVMAVYEDQLHEYEAAKKAKTDPLPEKPQKPILERITVNDATAEALVPILKENPRGVSLVRDELIGWVQAMNQYREGGKGADQQFWLSAWSGATVTVDRKKTHGAGPLRVRHPFLCVIGGLTPDRLNALRGDRPRQRAEQDGFIDRVLLSYPAEPTMSEENWLEVADETRQVFREVFDRLRCLNMVPVQDGAQVTGWRPFVVKLTESGRRAWVEFTRAHARERNRPDFPPHLVGPWSKLRGYCARLALILHLLRWAAGEVQSEDVDGVSMTRAAELVAYFKSHARKVYGVMEADPRATVGRRLLRWVSDNDLARFTRREAYRAMRGAVRTVDDIDPVLDLLEKHGFIRPVPGEDDRRVGRKASPAFDSHPSLLGRFGQNGQNSPDESPDDDPDEDLDSADLDSVHSVQSVPEGEEESQQEESGVAEAETGTAQRMAAAWHPEPIRNGDGASCEPSTPRPHSTPGRNGLNGHNHHPTAPYTLVRDAADLVKVAEALDGRTAAVDVETTGLRHHTDRARLLSIAVPTPAGPKAYLIDLFAVDARPVLDRLSSTPVLVHNAVFDIPFLYRMDCTPTRVMDTLLESQVLHGARKGKGFHSLAGALSRELSVTISKNLQGSDWSGELTPEQLQYAALDVLHLADLHARQAAQIDAAGLAEVMELETRAAPAVAWLASSGVPFDRDEWNALAAEAEGRLPALEKALDEIAPRRDGFLLDRGAWNWRSDEQVKEAFTQLGFPLENTRDETLAEIDHPLACTLREFRAADKAAGTYGKSWPKGTYAGGRIYAEWRQLGCITGRMSGGKPNLQNLPGDPRYRTCFRAPEGRVLVRADYGQIELRLAARISGDKAMLAAYARGDDLHSLTARQMTGKKDVTKQERSMAKPVNFGLIYGLGARSLAKKARVEYGLAMTTEDAERYKAAFFRAYPGIARWHRELRSSGSTEVRTLTGRRVPVEAEAPPGKRANYIVQGSGGDGLKLALALLWERRADCPGAFPVLAVHDEIVVECDKDRKDEAVAWLKAAMVDAMAPLLDPVPVEVEVKAGQTWGGA